MEDETSNFMIESLVGMGFNESLSRNAVAAVHARSLDEAVDWIMDHPEEPPAPQAAPVYQLKPAPEAKPAPVPQAEPAPAPAAPVHEDSMDVEPSSSTPGPSVTPVMRCNTCGATFNPSDENGIARHAATGHTDFSESIEEMKETKHMTESEKQAEIARVNALLKKIREDKALKAKQDSVEYEKRRREEGKLKAKNKEQFEEMKKNADMQQAAKDKKADREYMMKIKAQLAADKAERQRNSSGTSQPMTQPAPAPQPAPTQPAPSGPVTEISIRVKFPEGSETLTFQPNATIKDLERSISQKLGHKNFNVFCQFPRKKFTPADANTTLIDAQLHPRGSVIVELTSLPTVPTYSNPPRDQSGLRRRHYDEKPHHGRFYQPEDDDDM